LQIRQNLRQLAFRATFSFFIILAVLVFFLRYLRFAFIVQGSILVSVLGTLLLLFVARQTLNLFTLAGLALGFGILVDNSVVVLENIQNKLEQGLPLGTACQEGPLEVVQPVLASTLTTVVAILPFLYMTESLRLYYEPFAVTVTLALLVSLAVAFSLIPMSFQQSFRRHLMQEEAPPHFVRKSFQRFRGLYTRLLKGALRHPYLTLAVTLWMFGLPVWLLPNSWEVKDSAPGWEHKLANFYNAVMNTSWMQEAGPYLDYLLGGSVHLFFRYVERGELWNFGNETYVSAFVRFPRGTRIVDTDHAVQLLEQVVVGLPGVQQVRSRVYPDHATVTVRFTPAAQHSVTPFLVKGRLIARAVQIGNAGISVMGYGPGFSTGLGGVSVSEMLELTGYNYAELSRLTDDIRRKLERNRRVRDVRTDLTHQFMMSQETESSLTFYREELARFHIAAQMMIDYLNPYLIRYLYRQRLRIGWQEIPYILNAAEYSHFYLYKLQRMPLRFSNGVHSAVNLLADLRVENVPGVIERENQQYYRLITFDYLAPYRFAQRFMDQFVQTYSTPVGYHLKEAQFYLGGEEGEQRNIFLVLLLAVAFMYMILAGLYESFTYPILIFLIVPLSLIGVFLIYYLTDTVFNRSAYIGVIFMFGIILNNGIILLDRVNQLKMEARFHHFTEVLLAAGQQRLRPILITTLTTIVGLLPIVILSPRNGNPDIWYNLSLSTIGGLASGTVLGLVVLPTMVLLIERWKHRGKA
ncbi:MAG: efflux RND transporter permease subunit, partial [Calditrichaeota bacterium]